MKKHIGSTIALGIGVLFCVSGLTKQGGYLLGGIIIIIGALAYRSAKKRKLGEIRASYLREAQEVCAIVIIIAAVLLQKNLTNNIIDDPISNLIIPLWAIIAYLVISLKNKKDKKIESNEPIQQTAQVNPPVVPNESSRLLHQPSSKPHRGLYVLRHWRGELPLPVSYWVNVIVVTAVLTIALRIVPWDTFVTKSTKLCSTAVIALWVLLVIATIWQFVGVWRSAKNYLSQGKSRLWGNLGKIVVVLGVIIAVINFVSTGIPQMIEYAKIATGNDPVGTYQLRVLRDATELEIAGAIVFGLTDDVRRTLDAHPTIAIIHLNSEGGRVSEARNLRDLIGSKGLTTFTASGCFSACTLAYAGGKERLIAKDANLGFHQYSFPGAKARDFLSEYEKDKQDWLSRGFANDFVNRAFSTPNNEMWKPTHRELFLAGFVTGYPESDDVAATGFKLGDLENIEVEFAKNPLFSALKTYEPETYSSMLSELRSGLQKGRSQAELREKVFPSLQSVYMQRLPYASDSAIRSFATLFLEQMEVLYAVDTVLCYDYIFGQGRSAKLDVTKYFSKELKEKEFLVMEEVIRSAATQKHGPPQEKEIERQRAGILKSLVRRYGDDVQMLADPELGKTNKAKMCQLTYEFYKSILGLPEQESGPFLRFMFAGEK